MLTKRLQAQAIANRLAGLPDDTPLHHFTEPWRTCWQVLQNAQPGQEQDALLQVLESHPQKDVILGAIFAAQPGSKLTFASLAELSERLKPIEWVWQDWLPRGMLTVLGAAPGVGKSFLSVDLAWRVITRQDFPNGCPLQARTPQPSVIYVDAEAVPQIINKRAEGYGIDRDRLYLMLPDPGEIIDLDTEKYRERLIEMVATLHPELVIIDSLASVHSHGQNNVEDVRSLLHFLTTLAQSFEIGLLLLHHIRKPGVGQDMQGYSLTMSDLSGSGHIIAMARVVWGLHVVQTGPQPDKNGPRHLKMLKTNLGAYAEPLGFTFASRGDTAVLEWLDTPPDAYRPPTRLDECKDWLLTQVQGGPVKPKDIVRAGEAAGFSRDLIYRARRELEGQIVNTEGKNSPWNHWKLREQPQNQMIEPSTV
jgi:hypothetical protein